MTVPRNIDPNMSVRTDIYVHPQALCESDVVGVGSRMWAFSHIMPGATVGRECNIGECVFVESGAIIGDRVTVKNHVAIWDGIVIADDVFIGPAVVFTNDRYPRSPRMHAVIARYRSADEWRECACVMRGASLGAGAIILPGVTIGEYAVVGAGTVVSKDIAPHQLVTGNPARVRGWACICGRRLPNEASCNSCGRRYAIRDNYLVPEESA